MSLHAHVVRVYKSYAIMYDNTRHTVNTALPLCIVFFVLVDRRDDGGILYTAAV